MKVRRIAVALSAVVLIAGAALGAGVALGSGSSNTQTPGGDKSAGAAASLPRSPSPTKPKSQAYVHFDDDGTIIGNSKKVIAVNHTATGRYCVQMASSIHVHDNIFLQLTVDYFNSSPEFMVAMEGASSVCTGLGFPNSVRILTDSNDTGTAAAADVAVFMTIP